MNRDKILEMISRNTISSRIEEGTDLIHEIYVNDFVNELLKAITVTPCCKSNSELLPKRLSNEAYKCATTMDYNGFVTWWDKQV
jgi:hypothetical protein